MNNSMTKSIFQTVPLVEMSFLQKLLGQKPDENAVIELNNLFASKPIKQISKAEITDIEQRYNLALDSEFKLNLEEYYATYLNYCLLDKTLSNEELEDLSHLKALLSLDEHTITNLHNQLGVSIYKKSFEEAIADGRLTQSETDFLGKLEADLRLPKQLVDKISLEAKTVFIKKHITNLIVDEKLSPDEEKELHAIARSLNVSLQFDTQTKDKLQKLKLYWALENLELPTMQAGILLQKSEVCHFHVEHANWYEMRSVRQHTSHGMHSSSFRIAKGFYLRSGSYTPRSYSIDQMKLIDTGSLYVTNKRIIFTGNKKNSNIRFDKILSILPYSDGMEVSKETGKSPILQISDRSDIFCLILERLLRERQV